MDPISAILGLGLTAVGSFMQMNAAQEQNTLEKKDIGIQKDIEAKHHEAMMLDSNRKQLEVFRNNQRARAQGLEAAVNQGANFGSGLQGAYGQISGQTGFNLLGITQNTEIGNSIFSLNSQRSDVKVQEADAKQNMQFAQGISSLGNSIFGASKSLNNIFAGPSNSTPQPNYGY